ncbi:carbon-nitrogen hydrolase [Alkalimarinus alittae]|uniref:Carbon-nitrogen hydrolase n=1 Tax=Alkalimarinus alittae TaxID=2961619 RepID=A0ABY6N7J6_9ALTE|nr:carbon-nitrogen hydrolase [Alkalimarinus alittae]UZE97942.1 carbon-nitrogen hydrolase [Alkalimarinus alittae]
MTHRPNQVAHKDAVLKVAAIQQVCSADKNISLATSEAKIRAASQQGAKLVVLQELHATLYFCQTEDVSVFDLAETIPGPTTDRIASLAKELDIVVVCSIFEKRATGIYHNTAVVIESDGSIAGTYRKMHIPDDPGFYEKFYFTPGDAEKNDGSSGFEPINTSVGRLGVLVCWDQWYPEAARLMALAGADLLIYPTAIGWDINDDAAEQARQLDAWITVQRGHSIANNVPVIAPNRVGLEADPSGQSDGIKFWGNSFITGPQGEILAKASADNEDVLVADIDRHRSEDIRRIWPYFRDRRIDAYSAITKRYID